MTFSDCIASIDPLTSVPEETETIPALFGQGFCGATGAGEIVLTSTGQCGATGEATLPSLSGLALSGYNRTATGEATLPSLSSEGLVCGLDKPIDNGATSAAVVNLLQQGSLTIADAAAEICAGCATDDARAQAVVRYVAIMTSYVSDGDGVGDRWNCSLATWQRHYGDCEDGAILEHALLLAAGVNPKRLRTAFGTVLSTSLVEGGHAWLMYRRESDEEWIPLDWTQGPFIYALGLDTIRPQYDLSDSYTKISYILTNEKFYAVQDVNYIANLAANRATGEATLPGLTGDGTSGPSALGTAELPALTGNGLCGARGEASLPSLASTGITSRHLTARGIGTLPTFTGNGLCGARGEASLPSLAGAGQCGFSASGTATLPSLASLGRATVELLAAGAATFPALSGHGHAVAGQCVSGEATLPALTATGTTLRGNLARGGATLPALFATGTISERSAADGEAELPPLSGHGHAVGAAPWTHTLQYNSARWA